jgi:hypothetical protein
MLGLATKSSRNSVRRAIPMVPLAPQAPLSLTAPLAPPAYGLEARSSRLSSSLTSWPSSLLFGEHAADLVISCDQLACTHMYATTSYILHAAINIHTQHSLVLPSLIVPIHAYALPRCIFVADDNNLSVKTQCCTQEPVYKVQRYILCMFLYLCTCFIFMHVLIFMHVIVICYRPTCRVIMYCLSHVLGGKPMLAFAFGSTQLFLLVQNKLCPKVNLTGRARRSTRSARHDRCPGGLV